jgi:UDP-glucose:(heptosyl)LPS alpha-1,3-glucosyltransferase
MKLAFAIVNLFAGGGLQRDCIALARMAGERGHSITVFTARAPADIAPDLTVERLPVVAWTNHSLAWRFADALARCCNGRFDRVIGFNKIGGLDVLYCADQPVAAIHDRIWRCLPRGRAFTALEGRCFAPGSHTRLLMLSARQIEGYRRAWGTEPERMILLPPNLGASRRQPQYRIDGTRQLVRASLDIEPDRWVWLAIGVAPRTKGMDRVLKALAMCPDALLVIAGVGPGGSSRARGLNRWARWAGVADRVKRLGVRDDIPQLMAAADLLVHPARFETTGTVILEAIVNGLPVVATEACGYAEHIRAANAGTVVAEPFDPRLFIAALQGARDMGRRNVWSRNAVRYGDHPELFSGLGRAAEIICDKTD